MASSRIWITSPRRTAPELLESTFAFDPELLARLVERTATSVATPNKHYGVILGPRGVGKSHALALVVARVRENVAADDGVVAWLPDDPGGMTSVLHVFEAILAAVGHPAAVEERSADMDAAAAFARQRILDVLGGRTLLLFLEQLDTVLAALGDAGQRELRAFLQEDRCCAVLATANEMTRDLVDQDRVFYGFFGVQRLRPLGADAAGGLLTALARARGSEELAATLAGDALRPLLQTLHHMLGGLPSRYVDLVRTSADLEEPERILLRALDAAARDYRVLREQLSTQQRLLVSWLVRHGRAAPVKHVARACAIAEQTVSPQLRALRDAGVVRATRLGRESWYEVCEPLWGSDVDAAVELFRFLQSWFADRDAALQGTSPCAARLRRAAERDADDPRARFELPLLERRLLAPQAAPAS